MSRGASETWGQTEAGVTGLIIAAVGWGGVVGSEGVAIHYGGATTGWAGVTIGSERVATGSGVTILTNVVVDEITSVVAWILGIHAVSAAVVACRIAGHLRLVRVRMTA